MNTCTLCGRDADGITCKDCGSRCSVCGHRHALAERCETCGHHRVKSTTHSGYDCIEQPYERIER